MDDKRLDTTDIDNERKALLLLAEEVQKTTDDDTRNALIAEIQKTAAHLQELCDALQAKANELVPPTPSEDVAVPVVEIVLTRDQHDIVMRETGVDVPSVRIPDPNGNITKNMAFIEPHFVLECALTQATMFKQLVADAEQSQATEDAMNEVMQAMKRE